MSKLINVYQTKYTVIPNEVLFDKRLDFRTRGVFSTILALPDGWSFSIDRLADMVRDSERGEKETAIRAAIQYLEKLGYLERIHIKNEKGCFVGWDYKVNIPPIF